MKMKMFDVRSLGDKFSIFDWFFHQSSILNHQFLICAVAVVLVLGGCASQQKVEEPICEGKATAAEAVAALRQKQAAPLSLQAGIHCVMEFSNSKGQADKQDFDGKLFFISPGNLCIAGEKFGRIRIGADDKEFWVYVKPGLDTAWWGKKQDVPSCVEKLGFNPFYLAEALGQIDLSQDWTLMQQPGFDILVAPDVSGIKKVYINCCTYRVERIEYCDVLGRLIASADLSDYWDSPDMGAVPKLIELRHFRSARTDFVLRLKLSGLSRFSPTPAQQRLFERPDPKGHKSVYRWTENCEFIADTLSVEGRL
jgi:outer membrane murein-binding lipoprotein Lpp